MSELSAVRSEFSSQEHRVWQFSNGLDTWMTWSAVWVVQKSLTDPIGVYWDPCFFANSPWQGYPQNLQGIFASQAVWSGIADSATCGKRNWAWATTGHVRQLIGCSPFRQRASSNRKGEAGAEHCCSDQAFEIITKSCVELSSLCGGRVRIFIYIYVYIYIHILHHLKMT